MKVVKFEIENYKALSGRHEVIPDGSSFFLVGGNGKGKTSVGRVLIDMMTKNHPTKPITEGEYEGFARVIFDDLSEMMVKFEDTKKPKFTFLTPAGDRIATPKEFFEKMAGPGMTFDIDKFLSLAPKPRRAMLEEMVGIDLSFLNKQEEVLMEQARELRRDHKAQVARVKPFDPEMIDKEEIDVIDLSKRIAEQQMYQRDKKMNQSNIDHLHSTIQRLEKELAEAKESLSESLEYAEEINSKMVPEFEVAMWVEEMNKADEINKKIRTAKEMYKESQIAKQVAESLHKAEKDIEQIRKDKTNLIKSKPLPAEGLEFDPDGDGLLLNGLPFEDSQVATSAKMITALQIAEAQLGKIRYLHFDAAILDKENALKVLAWAESKGLQLCLERPMWDGGALKMEVYDKTGEVLKSELV